MNRDIELHLIHLLKNLSAQALPSEKFNSQDQD